MCDAGATSIAAETLRKRKVDTKRAQLNGSLVATGTNELRKREIRDDLRRLNREDEAARLAYEAALAAFTT